MSAPASLTLGEARRLCTHFGHLYMTRHDIIVAAFIAGMSRQEIAARMGLARQTVNTCIVRHLLSGAGPGETSPPPGP